MRKILVTIFILLSVVILIFVGCSKYGSNKHEHVEEKVKTYLLEEKKLKENEFTTKKVLSKENKNSRYAIEVKIKNDPRIYYYFLDDDKVKLKEVEDTDGVVKTPGELKD